jgi:hypothetical protein
MMKRTWTKPQGSNLPHSDIREVLSLVLRDDPGSTEPQDITIHGKTYRLVNVVSTYQISTAVHHSKHASLVDCGFNGDIAGEDIRVILKTLCSVDIQGLDNHHQVSNIPIVTVDGVVKSQCGDVIAIMHQYAYIGRGRPIYSSAQLEWYQNDNNNRSVKVLGGL